MQREGIHRFQLEDKRYAIDTETCFCFECDAISWDVLEYYPRTPVNRIYHLLKEKHDPKELEEVVGELEWLRSTKAILPTRSKDDVAKEFDAETGLKRVAISLPHEAAEEKAKRSWFSGGNGSGNTASARELAMSAIAMLLGRSEGQKQLEIEFLEEGRVRDVGLVANLCAQALNSAKLAGKELTAAVRVNNVQLSGLPTGLEGHTISARMEFRDADAVAEPLNGLAKGGEVSLSRFAKTLQPAADGVIGRIIARPNHPEFAQVVPELHKAGFKVIELDLDGAYVANPDLDPEAMLPALSESARYYATQLLQHRYFRLDPIARLFYRIYDGSPQKRSDPAGTHELAVDRDGSVYPTWRLLGREAFRLGSVQSGTLDEDARSDWDEVGSTLTGPCRSCWARNLCGGGTAAVHDALTGSFRKPDERWCDAQRNWMAAAVSAFNILSTEGVNFTRVYSALTPGTRPSLFTMVRAAFRMTIGMRPLEEADAEMLAEWENWNTASYFLFNERGVMSTTKYDREMDALHPQKLEQEMILMRKNGSPIGLAKLRPERIKGAAQAWIYLHDPADYEADDVRRGLRALLQEAGKQQEIRRLTIPASEEEKGLQGFLEAVGFKREGTFREALFYFDEYHDVHLYGATLESL